MKSEKDIRLLLEKFYDGTTTAMEEAVLKEYFDSVESLPEDLEADKAVFQTLDVADGEEMDLIEVPETLTAELSAIIDAEIERTVIKNSFRRQWFRIAGIAACVCFAITLGMFVFKSNNGIDSSMELVMLEHAYIPETEEAAIAETSRALMLMSEKLSMADVRMENVSYKIGTNNEY